MSEVLKVEGLVKDYGAFRLNEVGFSLDEGKITGFIGRNGAGKTTTLKSLVNMVHPDAGSIRFFGKEFSENEFDIKQDIGFVFGGVSYYPKKKLSTITEVSRRFYSNWDESAYGRFMEMFSLDGDKTPEKLSAGMKVKYSLTLALSHNAKLLILDEPTSGLDPVSRDDLLDVFMELVDKKGVTILFSTHITSDLEKCADNIIYIKNGTVIEENGLDAFLSSYRAIKLSGEQMTDALKPSLIGAKRERDHITALVRADTQLPEGIAAAPADLETIMVHMEKEE